MSLKDLKKIKEKIDKRRNSLLIDIRMHASVTRDMCDKLIRKIDNHGLDTYYSVNHDSLSRVRRLHKSCMELSLVRGFYESIHKEIKRIEEENESN